MSNVIEQEYEIESEVFINSNSSVGNPFTFCDKNLKRGRDKIKNWTFKSKKANKNYNIRNSDLTKNYDSNCYSVHFTDSTGKKKIKKNI